MKRVIVIGCCGSGKSTLSRNLGERLDLPVHHLDRLFWLPGWVQQERAVYLAGIAQILEGDRWIIDGNATSTLADRIAKCDTVIYLDFPRYLSFWGIIRRRFSRQPRPDMTEGCPERFDWPFYRYIWTFRKKQGPDIEAHLAAATHCQVHRLKSHKEVASFLSAL